MKQTFVFRNKTYQIDFGFIAILCILWATSCFALYNAFNLISEGSGMGYLIRQIFWYVIGFATIFILTSFQNNVIFKYLHKAYRYLMYMLIYLFLSRITATVLGFTLPLTPAVNGAISWFQIPLIGSFQPSEFMKIVLIVMVCETIDKHQKKYPHPTIREDWYLLRDILKIIVPPLILIFVQPDTGVFIIIAFTIFIIIACSGIRRGYVIGIIGLIVAVVVLFFFLYFYHQDVLNAIFDSYRLQ